MQESYIIGALRTPIGKAMKGSLAKFRPETLAVRCIEELLKANPQVEPKDIYDLILGCAMPEGEQGMNAGRMVALQAGLPDSVCGITINRYCSSGLQSVSMANDQILLGRADVMLAGGMESMSMIPMGGSKITPNEELVKKNPDAYLSMGLTAERVAEKWKISREAQDEYSFQSHQKAVAAIKAGKFNSEIVPIHWTETRLDDHNKPLTTEKTFSIDEGPREDTTLEALLKLKPAFKTTGSVTAGNSSQVSDGASMVLLASKAYTEKKGIKPLAKLLSFELSGIEPGIMGVGPAYAIPKALNRLNMKPSDIDLYEINEAFASQTLAVLQMLELDKTKVNVNGGAIALGHPLGCTGAKLTTQLIYELKRQGKKYGVVSMCIGGGMGAAGVFEVLP